MNVFITFLIFFPVIIWSKELYKAIIWYYYIQNQGKILCFKLDSKSSFFNKSIKRNIKNKINTIEDIRNKCEYISSRLQSGDNDFLQKLELVSEQDLINCKIANKTIVDNCNAQVVRRMSVNFVKKSYTIISDEKENINNHETNLIADNNKQDKNGDSSINKSDSITYENIDELVAYPESADLKKTLDK